ncbi:MAG: DUF1501 domain-containing protein, partial [Acidobacteria bacterium]|nr:DUF1501 domain-containing protein [Acidobacteriota bacterium]
MLRKDFVTAMISAPALTRALASGNPQKPRRNKGGTKKLVVVFLRGGNDGLNTVIPIESTQYARYAALRPRIAIPIQNVVPLQGTSFFGLHPSLQPLQPIYNNGHLCFIHCVGYPNPDRSHFESEAYFETATPGNTLVDGWLNRLLQFGPSAGGLIRGICIGSQLPQSLLGSYSVPVSSNFGNIIIGGDDENPHEGNQILESILSGTPTPGNEAVYATGNAIFQMVNNFSDRNYNNYVPENNANYYESSAQIGRRMRHAAQMLKETPSPLNIELAVIDTGGYDTHSGQVVGAPERTDVGHGSLLRDLARAMKAFYTDMGPTRMQDIAVMVISEFGRRAYDNDSNGTDHGTG